MATLELSDTAPAGRPVRTAWQVTFACWKALFLREATFRLSHGRFEWTWLLLEPLTHVLFLMILFSALHQHVIPGVDYRIFLAVGVLGYQIFKYPAVRAIGAIEANTALFAYRQVKPVDAALMRTLLEGFLQLVIFLILLAGAAMAGFDAVPNDPLLAFAAFASLWALGIGLGLVLSAASELIPEIGKIAFLIFIFFYYVSGIMFLPEIAPPAIRKWLLINPVIHGIETARGAFFYSYRPFVDISLMYTVECAAVLIFLGLALHVRFEKRLRAL